jgi:hypothetical protein
MTKHMKKLLGFLLLAVGLVATITGVSKAAIGYTATFQNPTVSGGHFSVDVYVLKTGTSALRVGNSNFWFTYNSAALSTPTIKANGIFNISAFDDYFAATLTSGTFLSQPYVSYNTFYNPAGTNGQGQQPSTTGNGTLVCTIDWVITNAAATTSLAFQSGGYALTTDQNLDVTSNGDWTSTISNHALPVELTSFIGTVRGSNVDLSWKTATEVNSSRFEIERRAAGIWEKIGERQAAGTSTAPRNYSYVDNLKNVGTGSILYRLKTIDNDGSYKYSSEVEIAAVPALYSLEHNYPNPFNPQTKIQYSLPENARVQLVIYDIVGRQVAELVNEEQSAGYYEKTFDGMNFSSGMYFYRITAQAQGKSTFTQVKKMMMIK